MGDITADLIGRGGEIEGHQDSPAGFDKSVALSNCFKKIRLWVVGTHCNLQIMYHKYVYLKAMWSY